MEARHLPAHLPDTRQRSHGTTACSCAWYSPAGFTNPGTEPRSPALKMDSLPAEPQGKPKNTGVGRLSLLQWIFLTQESNPDLLLCRWILYQLTWIQSQNKQRQTIPIVWLLWQIMTVFLVLETKFSWYTWIWASLHYIWWPVLCNTQEDIL